jgi:hypothetical protein
MHHPLQKIPEGRRLPLLLLLLDLDHAKTAGKIEWRLE